MRPISASLCEALVVDVYKVDGVVPVSSVTLRARSVVWRGG